MKQERITINGLIEEIDFEVTRRRVHRVENALVVGIAGSPGSGKSTTAEVLMRKLEAKGIITSFIPMDGYTYSSAVLEARGLLERRGSIETINVVDFINDLYRGYTGFESFFVPRYSRTLGEPIAHSLQVTPDSDVILTEGNYLLFKEEPGWNAVQKLLDISVFLETPKNIREERLFARYEEFMTNEEALNWLKTVDTPNADRVDSSIKFAQFVLATDPEENDALMKKFKPAPASMLRKTDTKPVHTIS